MQQIAGYTCVLATLSLVEQWPPVSTTERVLYTRARLSCNICADRYLLITSFKVNLVKNRCTSLSWLRTYLLGGWTVLVGSNYVRIVATSERVLKW